MGKVSVVQVQQDVPGNASREVFQGLFKDLGKQAMALEAILRAVCGRVDKMENWLTEVSFGMTELDLKLRNIAHNIDGTAAVDDSAQGPHRWAIPPPDDSKPLAPTVSKKLGVDKKAVRVTGMAAAILDRLATTSNATTPTAAETEKGDKPSSKKKSKEKKHSTKKVKPYGATEAAASPPLPAVSEIAVPVETRTPESQPVPAPVIGTAPEIEPPEYTSLAKEPMPPPPQDEENEVEQRESLVANETSKIDEAPPATLDEQPVTRQELNEIEAAEPPTTFNEPDVQATAEPVPFLRDQVQEGDVTQSPESDSSSCESSPGISPREPAESNVMAEAVPVLAQVKADVQSEEAEVSPPDLEQNASPLSLKKIGQERTSLVAPEPAPMTTEPQAVPRSSTPIVVAPDIDVGIAPTSSVESTLKTEKMASPAPKLDDTTPKATVSVSTIMPAFQMDRKTEPFVLKDRLRETSSDSAGSNVGLLPTTVAPEAELAPAQTLPVVTEASPKIVANPDVTPESTAAQAVRVVESNQPGETELSRATAKASAMQIRAAANIQHDNPTSHAPESTEHAADPLLPRRSSTHRRASKVAPRPSLSKKHEAGAEGDDTRRSLENKRGSQSRRISVLPQAKAAEDVHQPGHQLMPEQEAPATPAVPSTSPTTAMWSAQPDVNGEGDEGESDSSSDGSEASSGEEEPGDDDDEDEDEEAGAAVEEINKTMTALKKLKRAQMLSPEEEKELKERAHKKWFQLKGHIKEKQKKDVTNILLKRKKNVFTVSSRIELLEEKSREIYAALKQITIEMREKNDKASHETLRRRVADIEQSLQSIDSRIASLSAPAMEKVSDLASEVLSLRTTVQLQLTTAQSEATARHALLEEALASQRALVEALAQDLPAQLSAQADLFIEKLKQQPDYTAAIESLRRSLRRKADLKLLKEYVVLVVDRD
jgi:hypothetical protein